MRNPEDLIGLRSKSNSNNGNGDSRGNDHNNSNNKNDKSGFDTSYAIRYSSTDFLAEAVLIAGQPKFLVIERSVGSVSVNSSINVEGKILKPLQKEAYLSDPYSFVSEQEIYGFENEARNITLSDLYTNVKSLCQLFIVGDNNHITLLTADMMYTHYQDRLKLTHYPFFIGQAWVG